MRLALGLIATLLAADAHAASFKADERLPFSFKILSARTIEQDGSIATVVELDVRTGKSFLRRVGFHCDAEMKGGFTWNITGEALSLNKGERRTVRLVKMADEYSRDPTRLECSVSGFEASLF